MRFVKLTRLLLVWPIFFTLAALIHLEVSLLRLPDRWKRVSRLTRAFASFLASLLNLKVSLEGERVDLQSGAHVIVSNHLGYLDGIVLGSLFPVTYVSKKEVRHWPLIGQWTALCGTIYVDRKRKDKTPLLVEAIAKRLGEKVNVLIFPEGTSTNGERLLPFQSAHFAAPLRARAMVVPVTLIYKTIDGGPLSHANRDRIYWYGDMDFISHFWKLLALRKVEVSVTIHSPIETWHYRNHSQGRKQLSQDCYDSVSGRHAGNYPSAAVGSVGPMQNVS